MSNLRVSASQLSELQYNTTHVRNICIIAHIDHGKTTLADNLVCSNGIISQKMAGKLRYLDSTDDEQKRGITMYSSAISLLYSMEPISSLLQLPSGNDGKKGKDEYLINLVDSPGHIDFSSDVSTATRLCDGALLVVDVLEGICPQTHAVLYKALKDRMHPCLVLNKLDKLILELHLSPLEAFHHLRRIVERVNALASTLLNSELRARDELDPNKACGDDTEDPLVEIWNFAPEKGNVVFASAIDGWGFGLGRFALYWAKQLSLNKNILQKHLFDDFALNMNSKKIVKIDSYNPNAKPMFVTMVLEPIWQLYNVAIVDQNSEKAAKMAKRLGVEIAKRDIYTGGAGKSNQIGASSTSSASSEAYRGTLQAIMRGWLPLADAVLRTVVRIVPDPVISQQLKAEHFFAPQSVYELNSSSGMEEVPKRGVSKRDIVDSIQRVSRDVSSCRLGGSALLDDKYDYGVEEKANIVVFIAKMVPVRIGDLSPRDAETAIQSIRDAREKDGTDDHEKETTTNSYDNTSENINNTEVFLALGRVFSGTLSADSNESVYCLGNHHNPFDKQNCDLGQTIEANGETLEATSITTPSYAQRVQLSQLSFYMCLGPSVLPVASVPAGNIVCIFGLQDYVLKSSTLCSTPLSLPMKAITFQTKPMLRVAVEPKNHYNLRDLEAGLQQLYQYDPVVEIGVDDLGQSTITCLGELHLELCLKALSEKFAKCEVVASAPLVPFRETVTTFPSRRSVQSVVTPSSSTPVSGMSLSFAGLENSLPPPWKDLSGINSVRKLSSGVGIQSAITSSSSLGVDSASSLGAIHRLVVTTQLVAMTFRCFSLPPSVANFLNPDVDETTSSNAHVIAEFVSSQNMGIDNAKDGTSEGAGCRAMQLIWDQLCSVMLNQEGGVDESTVDYCLVDDFDREQLKKCSSLNSTDFSEPQMPSLLHRTVSLGPHSAGPNMLLFSPDITMEIYADTVPPEAVPQTNEDVGDDGVGSKESKSRTDDPVAHAENNSTNFIDKSQILAVLTQKSLVEQSSSPHKDVFDSIWSRLRGSIVSGFQMLTASGPLMQEPLQGVCFSIEKIEISARVSGLGEMELREVMHKNCVSSPNDSPNDVQPTSIDLPQSIMFSTGHLISDVRDSLKLCMLGCPLRLVEPVYKCSLQCDQLQLGNLYAVLSRRRGEVVDEDIIEGTSIFILTVSLPVANSFGFAQELLQKTSGSGTAPQLFFSHWSINSLDPFWKPTTTEEQEEFGTDGRSAENNLSRSFIDGVRRRKGLVVEEKMVVFAEKQRTLTRNK